MKKRGIGKEILEGIRDIKRGKGKRYIVNMPNFVGPRASLLTELIKNNNLDLGLCF